MELKIVGLGQSCQETFLVFFFFFCTWISGKVRLGTSISIAHVLGVSLKVLTLCFQNCCLKTVLCYQDYISSQDCLLLRPCLQECDTKTRSFSHFLFFSVLAWKTSDNTSFSLLAHGPEITMSRTRRRERLGAVTSRQFPQGANTHIHSSLQINQHSVSQQRHHWYLGLSG